MMTAQSHPSRVVPQAGKPRRLARSRAPAEGAAPGPGGSWRARTAGPRIVHRPADDRVLVALLGADVAGDARRPTTRRRRRSRPGWAALKSWIRSRRVATTRRAGPGRRGRGWVAGAPNTPRAPSPSNLFTEPPSAVTAATTAPKKSVERGDGLVGRQRLGHAPSSRRCRRTGRWPPAAHCRGRRPSTARPPGGLSADVAAEQVSQPVPLRGGRRPSGSRRPGAARPRRRRRRTAHVEVAGLHPAQAGRRTLGQRVGHSAGGDERGDQAGDEPRRRSGRRRRGRRPRTRSCERPASRSPNRGTAEPGTHVQQQTAADAEGDVAGVGLAAEGHGEERAHGPFHEEERQGAGDQPAEHDRDAPCGRSGGRCHRRRR